MKILLSKIFYYIGDMISQLLYFDCLSWLYPLYNKIMLMSCKLDKDKKVWKAPSLAEDQINELLEIVRANKGKNINDIKRRNRETDNKIK